MRQPVNPPVEFRELDIHYVQRVSNDEYSSSCPKCGGAPHGSGEFPDRFRLWIKSKTTGGALGWCRQCGYVWTPRGEPISPDRHEEWIRERELAEFERKTRAEKAIELLQRERSWLRYHNNLTGEVRHFYYDRLIDDYWINEWKLGYNPDKIIWDGEKEYHTPTLTIPVFDPLSGGIVTIRNRLLNPIKPEDKYRPEYGGLGSSLYYTDINKMPEGKVLVVEGEFKAMTTFIAVDDPQLSVVGIPGKAPNMEMFRGLDKCDIVYLLLDPDAYVSQYKGKISPIMRLISYFQERARVISLPYKVDDMITRGDLGKSDLRTLIKDARRAT